MGVWIETWVVSDGAGVVGVTPCMGVWIETSRLSRYSTS